MIKKTPPVVSGTDAAPFVYFDGVVASGNNNGVIQVEVAANALVPLELGKSQVKVKCVVTGHLRCGLIAAKQLYAALGDAIRNIDPAAQRSN